MSCPEKRGERHALALELEAPEFAELLRELRKTEAVFRRFARWPDVLAFMDRLDFQDCQRDEVLRPILKLARRSLDHRLQTILLAIIWPGLESIYSKRHDWDADEDALWQNLLCAFLKTVNVFNEEGRSERLTQKILNDSNRRLRDAYEREWERAQDTQPLSSETNQIPAETPTEDSAPPVSVESVLTKLRGYVDQGVINGAELDLIVATRIGGQSLQDYTRDRAQNYQAAKKRRQRAEAALRKAEEIMRENLDSLSP